jgi:excisionase family DNA binding protein
MSTAALPLPAVSRRYISIREATIYVGLSDDTLRRKIKAKELTAFTPTKGKILLDLHELDRLMRRSANRPSTRGQHLLDRDDRDTQSE